MVTMNERGAISSTKIGEERGKIDTPAVAKIYGREGVSAEDLTTSADGTCKTGGKKREALVQFFRVKKRVRKDV